MAFLILQTQVIPDWNAGGSTAKLRIFASQAFYEHTVGTYVPQGQIGNIHSACQVIDCVVSGTNLTIPEVTLATTTDSTVENAVYTAILYDYKGVARYTLLSQFFVDPSYLQVPAESSVLVASAGTASVNAYYTFRGTFAGFDYYNVLGESSSTTLSALVNNGSQWRSFDAAGTQEYHTSNNPTHPWDGTWVQDNGDLPIPVVSESATTVTSTWEQLTISNQASATVGQPFQWNAPFWSVNQTKDYINSLIGDGTVPYSSSLAAGKTYLSEDPVLASHPIAIGTNDPYWTTITTDIRWLTAEYSNNFATAVTAIGSTPAELMITETTNAISTNIVVPSTLRLTFLGAGALSVNNTKTVTIGLMTPAPSKQIFTGAGSVVLAVNAVPEKNLSWWVGNSSAADLSTPMAQFLTNGGRCFIPAGVWKCTNVTVPSYTTLRGAGNGADETNGTIIQLYDKISATCTLKVSEAFRDVIITDLTISTSSSTASSGLILQGTAPNTGTYFYGENLAFYGTGASAPAQFYVKDLGGTWQCEEIFLNHCQWVTPASGKSLRCDTPNTSITVNQGLFGGGANFTGVYGYFGFLTLNQCQAACTGASATPWSTSVNRTITQASITSGTKNLSISTGAFTKNDEGRPVLITGKLDSYIDQVLTTTTAHVHDNASATATNAAMDVYQWDANPARGNAFVQLITDHAGININNCTDEGMNYFLINDASSRTAPITINGSSWLQSWIQINQSCTLNLNACRLYSQTIRDAVGALAHISGVGNFLSKKCVQVMTGNVQPDLVAPHAFGLHSGGSVLQVMFNNDEDRYRQSMALPTTLNYGQEFAPSPDTTNGVWTVTSDIDTTGGPHIKLIEYGRSDAITEAPLYSYRISRDFDTGFSVTTGTQTAPNAGWQYANGPVIAETFRGSTVTPAQINTNAGTYLPLAYKRAVRMSSDANRTIAGVIFPTIGGVGFSDDEFIATNIGAFTITFLHQNAGAAAAARFICDTGANIVVQPNETIYGWYDATTVRWRVSKWNITGLTSDGTTATVSIDLAVSGDETIGGALTVQDPAIFTSGAQMLGGITMSSTIITFAGSTGVPQIRIPDNVADALSIQESTNKYLTFTTTNSGEKITAVKSLVGSSSILSTSPTAGIGYSAGSGGAVTQSTDKSTGVTSNTITTAITLNNAALNASTSVSFTFTNSAILGVTDQLVVTRQSAGTAGAYTYEGIATGAGTGTITVRNVTLGNLSEAVVIRVTVLRAVSA